MAVYGATVRLAFALIDPAARALTAEYFFARGPCPAGTGNCSVCGGCLRRYD